MEIIIAILVISFFCIALGLLTQNQTQQLRQADIDTIEKLLPQTQCGDCGFSGCRPYATALVNHEADINRCLPGGMDTVKTLATSLGKTVKPLYKNLDKYNLPVVALIDESQCIGCVKCIAACPVDAIVGAPKQMHSIIDMYCTGCELCIPPCPVDCISMINRQ